jgi:hypothetical protein
MADDEGAGTEVTTSLDSRIIKLPITTVLSKQTDDGLKDDFTFLKWLHD